MIAMTKAADWKSVKDAAVILNRSLATVYKWLQATEHSDKIPRRKIDRTLFVHMPSLLDYDAEIVIGRPRKK